MPSVSALVSIFSLALFTFVRHVVMRPIVFCLHWHYGQDILHHCLIEVHFTCNNEISLTDTYRYRIKLPSSLPYIEPTYLTSFLIQFGFNWVATGQCTKYLDPKDQVYHLNENQFIINRETFIHMQSKKGTNQTRYTSQKNTNIKK